MTGYYSYTDGNGQVVHVDYVADAKGYRVSSNAGVPSASVTVEGARNTVAPVETDFRKVFADFTGRVKVRIRKEIEKEKKTVFYFLTRLHNYIYRTESYREPDKSRSSTAR